MEDLVTIKTYTYAHEAAIDQSLLHSEGIFCFLKDQLTIQANPFYSNALGGVKLQVRGEDAQRAAELLQPGSEAADPVPKTIDLRIPKGSTLHECPVCGSDEISLTRKPSAPLFGLSLAFLGFPLTTFSELYHCFGCGRDIRLRQSD